MITNTDNYKNYILIFSDDPIKIIIPNKVIGIRMEVKGEIELSYPSTHTLKEDGDLIK